MTAMTSATLHGPLRDRHGATVGHVQVSEGGGLYQGSIDLAGTPAEIRSLFERYESMVNDQVLSVVDALELVIEELAVSFCPAGGESFGVRDLQVYPTAAQVSFRAR